MFRLDIHHSPIVKISSKLRQFSLASCQSKILIPIVLLGLMTSCKSTPNQQIDRDPALNARPKVVVTNTILCDLTRQIAQNSIDLVCLLTAGNDPHIYKITSSARQSIEDSRLVMYGGYNLEPELIKAIAGTSSSAPKVAVHELAVPQPQQFTKDGSKTIDPHIWHNAKNGIEIVKVIEANLEKLVPSQTAIYNQNTKKIISEITQIDRWIKIQVDTIPVATKVLITTHDALGYYAKAYKIPIDALEGVSTEDKPNAARAKALVDKIRKTQVPTIYTEATLNPQLIKTIAREANVKISEQEIYADGLGEASSSGGTYQKMLISNTKAIVEGLGGKYTPIQPIE
jgi:manganese/iron transport system substrate-binding protein